MSEELKLLTARDAEALTEGKVSARRWQQAVRLHIVPAECVIRFGRQLFLKRRETLRFLEMGGAALAGGWRQKPPTEKPSGTTGGELAAAGGSV